MLCNFNRNTVRCRTILDPGSKGFEHMVRLAAIAAVTVSQAWHLKVTVEVTDVWQDLRNLVVVMLGSFRWGDVVGLSKMVEVSAKYLGNLSLFYTMFVLSSYQTVICDYLASCVLEQSQIWVASTYHGPIFLCCQPESPRKVL